MLARNNITKIKIIMLLLIFIVPTIISSILYNYHEHFHLSTSNHGNLLTPPVHDESLSAAAGNTWQLVYAPANCESQNADAMMFTLHQLRLLLGKDIRRVSLTLLTENDCKLVDTHDFHKLTFNNEKLREQMHDHNIREKIFLIDPLGNIFMYYDSNTALANIFKDLKHVLEVSQIG